MPAAIRDSFAAPAPRMLVMSFVDGEIPAAVTTHSKEGNHVHIKV